MYVMPVQYLKKELSYEVDVLNADTHENLSQVDIIIFDGFGQACPNYLGKFSIPLWHLKKEVRNEGLYSSGWFKYHYYNLLYIQCSLIIGLFPLSIWNPYQTISSFD